MRRLLSILDRITLGGAVMACILIVAMLALIMAEIISRKVLGVSIEVAWEWASYFLAISFLAGSGHVLRSGFHVRVQLALTAFGPKWGRVLDTVATAMAAIIASYFTYALVRLAGVSYTDETRSSMSSNTLLWPFQALFAVGAIFLALQFFARLIRIGLNEPLEITTADAPLMQAD